MTNEMPQELYRSECYHNWCDHTIDFNGVSIPAQKCFNCNLIKFDVHKVIDKFLEVLSEHRLAIDKLFAIIKTQDEHIDNIYKHIQHFQNTTVWGNKDQGMRV